MQESLKELIKIQRTELTEVSTRTDFRGLRKNYLSKIVNFVDNLLLLNNLYFNHQSCFKKIYDVKSGIEQFGCIRDIYNQVFDIEGIKITRLDRIADYSKLRDMLSTVKSEDSLIVPVCLSEDAVTSYGRIDISNSVVNVKAIPTFSIRSGIVVACIKFKGEFETNKIYEDERFNINSVEIELIITNDIKMEDEVI